MIAFKLRKCSIKTEEIDFIPVSALLGENIGINFKFSKMQWYTGPTLTESIHKFKLPKRNPEKPLRIAI